MVVRRYEMVMWWDMQGSPITESASYSQARRDRLLLIGNAALVTTIRAITVLQYLGVLTLYG